MKTNYIMLKRLFELKSKGELLIVNDKQYEIVDCNLFYLLLPQFIQYEKNGYNLHFKKTSLSLKNIQLVFSILDKLITPYRRILIYSKNAELIYQFFKKTFPGCVFEDHYHKEQTHPDIIYFLFDDTNAYFKKNRESVSIKSLNPIIVEYQDNKAYNFNSYATIDIGVYPLNDSDIKTLFENEVTIHEYFIAYLLWNIKRIDNHIYETLVNNIKSTFVKSLKDIDEHTNPQRIVSLIRNLEPEMFLNIKYEQLKFIYG